MKLIISIFLLLLAFTVKFWSPWFIKFIDANTDVLQGIEAFIQILLFVLSFINFLFAIKNIRKNSIARNGRVYKVEQIRTKSGDIVMGNKTVFTDSNRKDNVDE